jgi:hypothetical protein
LITPAAPCLSFKQGTAYTWVKIERSHPSYVGQFETIFNSIRTLAATGRACVKTLRSLVEYGNAF